MRLLEFMNALNEQMLVLVCKYSVMKILSSKLSSQVREVSVGTT